MFMLLNIHVMYCMCGSIVRNNYNHLIKREKIKGDTSGPYSPVPTTLTALFTKFKIE